MVYGCSEVHSKQYKGTKKAGIKCIVLVSFCIVKPKLKSGVGARVGARPGPWEKKVYGCSEVHSKQCKGTKKGRYKMYFIGVILYCEPQT